jgi:uncharacterized protein YaaQ
MSTKLILVVARGGGCDKLVRQLNDAGFRITEFSSIGGFLRHKNTTLIIGCEEEQLEQALDLIRKTCPTPQGSEEHNATVFVLNAGQLVRI